MYCRKILGSHDQLRNVMLMLIVLLALGVSAPAYAVTAGITLDVHQDVQVPTTLLPNDFHVEGKICSKIGPPTLTSHTDGPFPNFSYTITKVVPADPTDCWYTFTGDWSFPAGSAGIPYCTVIHLGLVFDVDAANVMINLVGWWTRDGKQIGDVITGNNFVNGGYVPVTGFNVGDDPAGHGESIRITNRIQQSPQFPPMDRTPPAIPIEIVAMDLISFPAGAQPSIDQLREGGAQEGWQWVHAVAANGSPIGPTNPVPLAPDSFFDVFTEMTVDGGAGLPQGQQFTTPPGGSLAARVKLRFTNNSGVVEEKWQWDIHGAPALPLPCHWNPNDPAKWIQMPDVSSTGMDLRIDADAANPRVIADDFRCTSTGRITDVHFWGSWLHDIKGEIESIHLSIHKDIPAGTGGLPYSRPQLPAEWQHDFTVGQFSESLYATLPTNQYEWFWDPAQVTANPIQLGDQQVWQYDICIDPAIAYVQQGTAANPIIYWLDIQVRLKPVAGNPPQFGWKTRDPIATHYGGGHFMDDAVVGPPANWTDLHYPSVPAPGHPLKGQSLDMAFVITGETIPSDCCLTLDKGPLSPPDHVYACNPFTGNPPNFMSQVKICNPCSSDISFDGLVLQALGTGNDLTGVQSVTVYMDRDCDGKPDTTPAVAFLTGSYSADNGTLTLCDPTKQYTLKPGACVCLLVYYKMNCSAPVGTYYFNVVSLLSGTACQPICVNTHVGTNVVPLSAAPVQSAIKTIEQCCPTIVKGPNFPVDHNYVCVPGVPQQANFMAEYKLCNPCQTDQVFYGLQLVAGGTGNDLTGVQQVMVSLDWDCDGKPESVNVLSGSYPSDNGTLNLCSTGGAIVLAPGQCVCIRIYYVMNCNAPAGTYYFDLTALLGSNCLPVPCVEGLPIHSATKTVISQDCCLNVFYGPTHPADHTFTCPPVGTATPLNKMMNVKVCNPCPTDMLIFGFNLQAYGSGNDLTGIVNVYVAPDMNCDGKDDSTPIPMGTYNADNGTLSYCQASSPIAVLSPGQCGCFNIYYKMACPNPVPGTYLFTLTEILGSNCKPICVTTGQLPLKSAIKTIEPQPCCLDVTVGPNNPPSHKWWPGLPLRNRMFQFKVCNPCQFPAKVTCLKLKASGTGNDSNDIQYVRVIDDLNSNGVADLGEPQYGGLATYSSDNGMLTLTGGAIIPAGTCKYFLVEYIMKNSPIPTPAIGATYCMTLTNVCAINVNTGADFCVKGVPLKSNCKERCTKIGPIPHFPTGLVLCLQHKVITAVFQDRFYVQDQYGESPESDPDAYGPSPDRSAGIAIIGSVSAPLGSVVNIEGTTDVVNCEAVVRSSSVELLTDPLVDVKPMAVNNRNSGGGTKGNQPAVVDSFFDVFFSVETNNVGLLMTASGKVTDSDGRGLFWIDDGSGLKDGTFSASGQAHLGVKVNATYVGWAPPIGSFATVTGIVRAEDHFGKCIRVLYPRGRADISAE